MKKELVKLASDLDRMGYKKTANKVDDLLAKIAGLYDGFNEWGDKSRWYLVNDSSIAQDFYDFKSMKGTQSGLDSYLSSHNVADWQKEKVIRAITSDKRWSGNTPASDVVSESSMSTPESVVGPEVTAEDFHKLLIADKDDGTPYKMSDETFRLGSRGYITSGPLPALNGKLTDQELEIIKSNK
jgi:hypothetical protein